MPWFLHRQQLPFARSIQRSLFFLRAGARSRFLPHNPVAMKKDSKPIFNAMYKVVEYAEKCYKKEYAKDTMEQLTKILTGEKDEEIKKH